MNLIALQTRVCDDAAQHARDEQTSFILCDAHVHLLVIQIQTWETKAQQHDHRTGCLDLANDRPKIPLRRRNIHAAKKVIAAESDNNDARVVRQNVAVDAIERHVGGVTADSGIDHRRPDEPGQPRWIILARLRAVPSSKRVAERDDVRAARRKVRDFGVW